MTARVRFAPSPNGPLHLGHAYSALFTQHTARELEAQTLLRIEDIDVVRCKPQFSKWIVEDLTWLGFHWRGGVRHQSSHLPAYTTALDRLDKLRLLYPCFCTRKKLAAGKGPRDPDGAPVYPGYCKLLTARDRMHLMTAGTPYALRLDMSRAIVAAGNDITFNEHVGGPEGQTGQIEITPQDWGDVVLARKDIGTSYHIAVVVDDAVQKITHITRGQDLFHATSIHRVLQILLEMPQPQYFHHRLIADDAGRKLSKSADDRSLRSLRDAGISPAQIHETLGFD